MFVGDAGRRQPQEQFLLLMQVFAAVGLGLFSVLASAQKQACPRPAPGSVVTQPEELRSHDGSLKVDLTYSTFTAANGQEEYCYQAQDGSQAPTMRLRPGDLLILRLQNKLAPSSAAASPASHHDPGMQLSDPCAGAEMTALSTNLHFHGLTVPPVCHQDDVLHTAVQPGTAFFEYRFSIPPDQPPGLYWYHPHVHGFTNTEVLGGASGALMIEGIERANSEVAGLPERVLVIRDQDLLYPDAQPVQTDSMPPPFVMRDAEADILNSGTGGGKPAKDLSVNFVPVPFP